MYILLICNMILTTFKVEYTMKHFLNAGPITGVIWRERHKYQHVQPEV